MKLGEAFFNAGKADEAPVEIVGAAQLDLTPTDKAGLARLSPYARMAA